MRFIIDLEFDETQQLFTDCFIVGASPVDTLKFQSVQILETRQLADLQFNRDCAIIARDRRGNIGSTLDREARSKSNAIS